MRRRRAERAASLTIEIEPPEGDAPGTLKLSWGEHRWQTTLAAAG